MTASRESSALGGTTTTLAAAWTFAAGGAVLLAEVGQPWLAAGVTTMTAASVLLLHRETAAHLVLGPFWLLVLLATIGTTSLWLASAPSNAVDVARDGTMVMSPFAFALVALSFAKDAGHRTLLLRVLVSVGLVISAIHIYKIASYGEISGSNLEVYRLATGRGSPSQVVALTLLTFDTGRAIVARTAPRIALTLLITVSIVLTFSRSLLLFLLLLVAALVVQHWRASAAGKTRITLGATCLAAVIVALATLVTPPPEVQAFYDKVERSATEVGSSTFDSTRAVTMNYRAYETQRAVDEFHDGGPVEHVVGYGWGSRVDLLYNTAATTADFTRSYAPILHNGYAYYLFKTGVLGLATVIAFLLILGLTFIRRLRRLDGKDGHDQVRSSTYSWIGLLATAMLALGMFVVGGMASPSGFGAIYLVIALSYGMSSSGRSTVQSASR